MFIDLKNKLYLAIYTYNGDCSKTVWIIFFCLNEKKRNNKECADQTLSAFSAANAREKSQLETGFYKLRFERGFLGCARRYFPSQERESESKVLHTRSYTVYFTPTSSLFVWLESTLTCI